MKKYLLSILILPIFLTLGCQRQEVIKTHGISYLEKREKLVTVNKSNKNDVIDVLGYPSTRGMLDNNTWIYIERTRTRGKLLKLGRNVMLKNNILVLEFDRYGVLASKELYDKNKMNELKFNKNVTSFEGKKENFIYSFLSSVRQKMIRRKTKN